MLSFPRINLPIVTSNVITGFRARDHEWAYLCALSVVPVTFVARQNCFMAALATVLERAVGEVISKENWLCSLIPMLLQDART